MINSVTLIGRMGSDPELKTNAKGTAFANFPLACHEYRKVNGERQTTTHWFNCLAFGEVAKRCSDYARRGARVGIRGSLRQHSWETKEGVKRSSVEVQVRDIEFLSPAELKS